MLRKYQIDPTAYLGRCISVYWDLKPQTKQKAQCPLRISLFFIPLMSEKRNLAIFGRKVPRSPFVGYFNFYSMYIYLYLSHDVASGSDITPCNKIDKPLVV